MSDGKCICNLDYHAISGQLDIIRSRHLDVCVDDGANKETGIK